MALNFLYKIYSPELDKLFRWYLVKITHSIFHFNAYLINFVVIVSSLLHALYRCSIYNLVKKASLINFRVGNEKQWDSEQYLVLTEEKGCCLPKDLVSTIFLNSATIHEGRLLGLRTQEGTMNGMPVLHKFTIQDGAIELHRKKVLVPEYLFISIFKSNLFKQFYNITNGIGNFLNQFIIPPNVFVGVLGNDVYLSADLGRPAIVDNITLDFQSYLGRVSPYFIFKPQELTIQNAYIIKPADCYPDIQEGVLYMFSWNQGTEMCKHSKRILLHRWNRKLHQTVTLPFDLYFQYDSLGFLNDIGEDQPLFHQSLSTAKHAILLCGTARLKFLAQGLFRNHSKFFDCVKLYFAPKAVFERPELPVPEVLLEQTYSIHFLADYADEPYLKVYLIDHGVIDNGMCNSEFSRNFHGEVPPVHSLYDPPIQGTFSPGEIRKLLIEPSTGKLVHQEKLEHPLLWHPGYTTHNPNKSKVDAFWVLSYGFNVRLIDAKLYHKNQDHPRAWSKERLLELNYVPQVLFHISTTDRFQISSYYAFPDRVLASSPQYLGENLVVVFIKKEAGKGELWFFVADKLSQGPVYKFSHADLYFPSFLTHVTQVNRVLDSNPKDPRYNPFHEDEFKFRYLSCWDKKRIEKVLEMFS